MNIQLKEFQKKCIIDLLNISNETNKNEILLKSPTGSGKTIIMLNFIDQYLRNNIKTVFIWLTPDKRKLNRTIKNKNG